MEDEIKNLFRKYAGELTYELPSDFEKTFRGKLIEKRSKIVFLSSSLGLIAATVALFFTLQHFIGRNVDGEIMVQEVTSAHVRSMMAQHLSDVVSSDQHTVKPWFDGRLDFAPTVKDFSQDGFPLVGGRLDYVGER